MSVTLFGAFKMMIQGSFGGVVVCKVSCEIVAGKVAVECYYDWSCCCLENITVVVLYINHEVIFFSRGCSAACMWLLANALIFMLIIALISV